MACDEFLVFDITEGQDVLLIIFFFFETDVGKDDLCEGFFATSTV